eukprot:GAHX01001377.1.p1 GENE.GAHX01001377.1~~GAHX01001377.1.p1  ORF type:complete len:103 (-),score=18.51 GAHX01001377.1:30-338(-)
MKRLPEEGVKRVKLDSNSPPTNREIGKQNIVMKDDLLAKLETGDFKNDFGFIPAYLRSIPSIEKQSHTETQLYDKETVEILLEKQTRDVDNIKDFLLNYLNK